MGIGTVLLERGLVSEEELRAAITEQSRTGERLDHVLVRLGHVSATQVLEAIGHQFAMPIVDLDAVEVKPEVLRALPARLVFKQRCVPLEEEDGRLRVATSDPFELTAFDELKLLTGKSIDLVLADEQDIRKFIRQHYGVAGDTLDELSDGAEPETSIETADDPAAAAEEASVVKLVNDLLLEAVRERATDIHFEPYEDRLVIRYRIDGVLTQAGVPTTVNRFRHAIVSRLKIMANLNIAEKRTPQDGRISLRLDKAEYDLRVSVIPMLYGEGVVLRVLNKSAVMMTLDDLGMDPGLLETWDDLIGRPHGILLVTGPTGSGKSTTLYASLARIIDDATKAITVEDPVEYDVGGVNQIQVNRQVGLDFAAGLRAILRHDPDVIMIGEIRDLETAVAAVQASLTGHLVFSTLHTNDAPSAITRLIDMGVKPFLVASSIQAIMAQRLVRVLCDRCKEPDPAPDEKLCRVVGIEPSELAGGDVRRPVGCSHCNKVGFKGRKAIFEMMRMNAEVRELAFNRAGVDTIRAAAIRNGMWSLVEDGKRKILKGITTPAEVARFAQAETLVAENVDL